MKPRARRLRLIAAAGLGAAGVFGGHVLTYALVVEPHKHRLLIDVAHGYLPFAGLTAAVAGFVALLAGVGSGYVGDSGRRVWAAARRLALAQGIAFVALEVLERLAVGASLADLRGPILAVGLVAQFLIAVAAALLLAGLRRVGEVVARKVRTRARPVALRTVVVVKSVPLRRGATPIAVRAPPSARAA